MKQHFADTRLFLWKLFVFLRYDDLCWPHLNEQCWRCHQSDFDHAKAAALRRVKQALQQRADQ